MPAKQGARVTNNAAHRTRGSSRDRPANTARSQIQPAHLAAQHRDLIAQDEHLDALVCSPRTVGMINWSTCRRFR
jgi:hypothetical protein